MIISISGRIASGKDAVASIIQELHPEQEWAVKKWAGKIKEMATMLTGVPVEKWEDQEFKKTNMGAEWGQMTYREFLQKFGTDAVRDNLHRNAWVNSLMSGYKAKTSYSTETGWQVKDPNWLVTDTRFRNEAVAIKMYGGVTLLVVRPCKECTGLEMHWEGCSNLQASKHESETALDGYQFDYKIVNNGTIVDLKKEVKKFLKQFKLCQK